MIDVCLGCDRTINGLASQVSVQGSRQEVTARSCPRLVLVFFVRAGVRRVMNVRVLSVLSVHKRASVAVRRRNLFTQTGDHQQGEGDAVVEGAGGDQGQGEARGKVEEFEQRLKDEERQSSVEEAPDQHRPQPGQHIHWRHVSWGQGRDGQRVGLRVESRRAKKRDILP